MKAVQELHLNAGAAVVSFNIKIPICEGQYPLFTNYPKYKVQTREELAEEIMNEMKEREDMRNYKIALNEQIMKMEEKQQDFISRAKAAGLNNHDIVEQYHQELMLKRSNLAK